MLQLLAVSHNKFSGQIPAPEGANQLGDKRMSTCLYSLGLPNNAAHATACG